MRILIWLPGDWPAIGGVESFTATLAYGLVNLGHQVSIIAFAQVESALAYEVKQGVEVYRFPHAQRETGQAQLSACRDIMALIGRIQPCVLHMQYTANANLIYYFLLARQINIPLVVTTHGLLCEEHFLTYQQLIARATAVVCVSRDLLNVSVLIAPESRQKSMCIHNGVEAHPEKYQLPIAASFIFLCVGRLTHEKGYDLAISAFAKMVKKHPSARLKIIGAGIEKNTLLTLVKRLLITSQVDFLPALAHEICLAHMQSAHVILIPSRYESFGLVAIEAALMGRAVIATKVGGLVEIVTDRTGMLVPKEDVNALCAAMCLAFEEPAKMIEKGHFAFQHVRKRFSAEKMVLKYINLYSKHVEKKAGLSVGNLSLTAQSEGSHQR